MKHLVFSHDSAHTPPDLDKAISRAIEAARKAPGCRHGVHVSVVVSRSDPAEPGGLRIHTGTTLPDRQWASTHLAHALQAIAATGPEIVH